MPRWSFLQRRFPLILTMLLCALAAVSLAAAAEAATMTVDDVVALLKAGVGEPLILAQAEASGSRMTLSVDEILRLKSAGATDTLIASLMQGPEATPEEASPGFRIYTEITGTGEKVIHITNLDASGRRIGGEVPDPAPRNVISSASSPGTSYDNDPGGPSPASSPTNVYVEVYPPEPEAPEAPPMALGGYGGLYPGYLPGYIPGYSVVGRHRGPGRSRLVGPSWSAYSPPGSWSHFERYHHRMTAPYRAGSAAARNRATFRRH